MKKIVGIYKITSPSGKVYVGQSWDIKKRWSDHRGAFKSSGFRLENSIKKYGHNSHTFEIIHELPADLDQSILDTYEILYISQYKNCGVGMLNLMSGGSNGKHCEESKIKMSKVQKGRKHTEESKRKMSEGRTGLKASDETRAKMSESKKGRFVSEQTRKKIIANNISRVVSEQTKEKIRKTLLQRKSIWLTKSSDTREKHRINMLGNKRLLGKKFSEETKLKMSESAKRRWLNG